jgi:fatty-acyl-CoA synthase
MLEGGVHRPLTYADLLSTALGRFPSRDALCCGETRMTYGDVSREVHALMEQFKRMGIGYGKGVALLSRNNCEVFIVMAAAVMSGCRYTPLHPGGGEADHAFIVRHSEANLLIFDAQNFEDRVEALSIQNRELQLLAIGKSRLAESIGSLSLGAASAPKPSGLVSPNDICHLSYTGGTTGRPKGVMRSHRCMVTNAVFSLAEWDWPEEIKFLAATPMSHGVGAMVVPVLLRGGTVVIHDGFVVQSFVDTIVAQEITTTFMVPTMLYRMIDYVVANDVRMPSLETVIYGAAPVNPTKLAEAVRWCGPKFMQLYGQVEAPNLISVLHKADHDPDRGCPAERVN